MNSKSDYFGEKPPFQEPFIFSLRNDNFWSSIKRSHRFVITEKMKHLSFNEIVAFFVHKKVMGPIHEKDYMQ